MYRYAVYVYQYALNRLMYRPKQNRAGLAVGSLLSRRQNHLGELGRKNYYFGIINIDAATIGTNPNTSVARFHQCQHRSAIKPCCIGAREGKMTKLFAG